MIFLNTRKLADRLKNDKVPPEEQLKYCIAWLVIFGLASLSNGGYPHDVTDVFSSLIQHGVGIFVFIVCFQVNKQGDGYRFLERLICIAWPAAVRCLLIFLVIDYIFEHFFLSCDGVLSSLVKTLFYAVPTVLFYWMLFSNIRYISRRGNPNEFSAPTQAPVSPMEQ